MFLPSSRPAVFVIALVVVFLGGRVMDQVKSETPDTRLQQRLTKFPQADANGDGILTQSEAEAFQKARKQAKTSKKNSPGGEPASPTHADVSYGSHDRNKLDFWKAKSG